MYETQDRIEMRKRALAATFQKTNRILTGDRGITVQFADGDIPAALREVPGWTTYPEIFFNPKHFHDFWKKETVTELLGLNYHELGHNLFTPRRFKEKIKDKASNPKWALIAYSYLEDQRQESLFSAIYEPSGKYFTSVVVKMFVAKPRTWSRAFLLTHGRSYLPLEIREEFEARFVRPDLIDSSKHLIDKYKGYVYTDFAFNTNQVVRTCELFGKIIEQTMPKSTKPSCDNPDDDMPNQVDTDKEEEASQKDQERHEKEEETGEDQSGFWEDDEEDDDEAGDGDPADGDDSDDVDDADDSSGGSESEDGDSDSDERDDDGDAGDDGDGVGEDDAGSDNGSESGDADSESDSEGSGDDESGDDLDGAPGAGDEDDSETQFSDYQFRKYLADISKAVQQDDAVQNELERITNSMNEVNDVDVMDFRAYPLLMPVTDAGANLHIDNIVREVQRLYAEVEPGWNYGSDYGKLNVGRAMIDPDNLDEAFDEWDEGREQDTGLEVVFDLDISISMKWEDGTPNPYNRNDAIGPTTPIWQASEALWILKRAFDELDVRTTVLGFHGHTVGLIPPGDKVERDRWPLWNSLGGSTEPVYSFHLARRVLGSSEMPNRIFVCITDGDWRTQNNGPKGQGGGKDEDIPTLLDTIPGHKIYVGIGGGNRANPEAKEHFDSVIEMTGTHQLVDVVEKAVTKMLQERTH